MRPVIARTAAGAAAVAGALAVFRAVIDPRLATWGARVTEADERLTGDDLVAGPAATTTRAVTIAAPASTVWQFLVQIGTGRGGWYSYDWLERAVGVPVHNTDQIRDEWQDLAVGDRVVLAPPGWMGVPNGFVMPVARIVPGESIVLRQEPPDSPWDGVWSFHVRPEGPDRCRLLIRSRTAKPIGAAAVMATIGSTFGDPVTFLMERRMLLGIKERAERAERAGGVVRRA